MTPEPAQVPSTRWVLAGPLAAIIGALLALSGGMSPAQSLTAGVAIWCATWWVTEAVPMAATALLPLAIFPAFSVITPMQAAQSYGHPLILLLLGGFILSRAMEKSGAHRRLALTMIQLFGADKPRRVLLGFVAASGFLSMWISNTATTLMLLPVALAALPQDCPKPAAAALLLAVAYAASVGGIGTPVGTPPNLIFMGVYGEVTGSEPGFVEWMSFGVPVALLGMLIIGFFQSRRIDPQLKLTVPDPGPWQSAERRVLIIFAITALLWVTRREPFGGWSGLLGLPDANDAAVALMACVVMFAFPDGRGGRLLDWETAVTIPWGVLVLFGGGLALAAGFVESGLSTTIGEVLSALIAWPLWIALLVLTLSVSFLTEVTSNTATTNLLMPILAAAGIAAGVDPAILMIPAAMSASCAFMLPVATAPNAIVYGSGAVPVNTMIRHGFILNVLLALVITGRGVLDEVWLS